MKFIPDWRPNSRKSLVEWISALAEGIACALLRHPMEPDEPGLWNFCPCARHGHRGE